MDSERPVDYGFMKKFRESYPELPLTQEFIEILSFLIVVQKPTTTNDNHVWFSNCEYGL